MQRRHLLQAICSAGAMVFTSRASSAELAVQLLVVREGREPTTCGEIEYLQGTLYGVPSTFDLEKARTTLGLERLGRVEEPTYEGNSAGSSIPVGTYDAYVRDDATKPWMTTLDRRWRIEMKGVPGPRTAVQFHYGKDYKWSAGCIILAGEHESLACSSRGNSSDLLVAKLRGYVEKQGLAAPTRIRVRIAFEDDLGTAK